MPIGNNWTRTCAWGLYYAVYRLEAWRKFWGETVQVSAGGFWMGCAEEVDSGCRYDEKPGQPTDIAGLGRTKFGRSSRARTNPTGQTKRGTDRCRRLNRPALLSVHPVTQAGISTAHPAYPSKTGY